MKTLLTIKQVAEIYGVTTMTVRRWTESGKLTAIKLGGKTLRYDADEVSSLITASETKPGNMVPTVDPITGK